VVDTRIRVVHIQSYSSKGGFRICPNWIGLAREQQNAQLYSLGGTVEFLGSALGRLLINLAWIYGLRISNMGLGLPFFLRSVSVSYKACSEREVLTRRAGCIHSYIIGTCENRVKT
jgi:hypothetical protein